MGMRLLAALLLASLIAAGCVSDAPRADYTERLTAEYLLTRSEHARVLAAIEDHESGAPGEVVLEQLGASVDSFGRIADRLGQRGPEEYDTTRLNLLYAAGNLEVGTRLLMTCLSTSDEDACAEADRELALGVEALDLAKASIDELRA